MDSLELILKNFESSIEEDYSYLMKEDFDIYNEIKSYCIILKLLSEKLVDYKKSYLKLINDYYDLKPGLQHL